MKRLLTILPVFVALFLTVSCNNDDDATPVFTLHEPTITAAEDYTIYSLILNQWPGNYYVVKQETGTMAMLPEEEITQLMQENNPGFEPAMAQTLLLLHENTAYLGNSFQCDPKVIRLTGIEELEYVFSPGLEEGWNDFYSYFNNPGGLIGFSQIAYNADHTKALVDMSYLGGPLFGEGTLIYLEKENGVWVIHEMRSTWMS